MMVPGQPLIWKRKLLTASAAAMLPAVLVDLRGIATACVRTEDGELHTVRLENLSPRRARVSP